MARPRKGSEGKHARSSAGSVVTTLCFQRIGGDASKDVQRKATLWGDSMTESPWDTPSPWGHEAGAPTDSPWGSTASQRSRKRQTSRGLRLRTPGATAWLALAVLSVALSAYFWRSDTTKTHMVGYVLAAFVTTTAVALYRLVDVKDRAKRNYEYRRWAAPLAVALILAAFALVLAHVWPLATEWSKP
jgi:L-asparagine transporter-like permease